VRGSGIARAIDTEGVAVQADINQLLDCVSHPPERARALLQQCEIEAACEGGLVDLFLVGSVGRHVTPQPCLGVCGSRLRPLGILRNAARAAHRLDAVHEPRLVFDVRTDHSNRNLRTNGLDPSAQVAGQHTWGIIVGVEQHENGGEVSGLQHRLEQILDSVRLRHVATPVSIPGRGDLQVEVVQIFPEESPKQQRPRVDFAVPLHDGHEFGHATESHP
jgi:hypothetical protein